MAPNCQSWKHEAILRVCSADRFLACLGLLFRFIFSHIILFILPKTLFIRSAQQPPTQTFEDAVSISQLLAYGRGAGARHASVHAAGPTLPAGKKDLGGDPPVGDVGSDCRGAALSSVSQSCGGCWRRSRPPLTPTPRNRARRRRPTGPARISGRGPLPPARPLTCRHVGVSTPCRYVSFPFSWPSPHVPPFFCRFRGRLPNRYVTLTCGPRS